MGCPGSRRHIRRNRKDARHLWWRIVRTRIPVWLLENSRRLETPEAEILRAYPQLRAEDLANAWAYVRSHRNEIDGEIQENEAA